MNEYYQKLDKSFFNYGITIPNDYVPMFEMEEAIALGTSRSITITFKNKEYSSRICNVNRKKEVLSYELDGR